MSNIFHSAKSFNSIPITLYPYSFTILLEHPNIKRNIMPNNMVRFVYIFQKGIYVTIYIAVSFQHIFTDSMNSLRKEIYFRSDIHVLIDPMFFMKFFSIKYPIYGSKLENLIRRRKSRSLCIDKQQSESFLLFWHTLDKKK